MNSYTIVELRLGCSHFDGDSETLHHFVATDSDQVKTDDLLFRSGTDHLHRGRLLVIGVHHRVVERSERSFVNLDLVISVLLARFGLSKSDSTDSGVRENDSRNIVVVQLVSFDSTIDPV